MIPTMAYKRFLEEYESLTSKRYKKMETIKQQADSYVDMFKPYAYGQQDRTEELYATRCAIIHVEGLISAIADIIGDRPYMWTEHEKETITTKKEILTELKSRI
jgi:hypothetical protein